MSLSQAKVFVSCGQAKGTGEEELADRVRETLEKELGFEVYVAIAEQTLKGLKENIFAQLESSEYFLFIDLPREQLANMMEHRGSLFSHQELAIASFLDMPVLAFQHESVKKDDGILRFLQVNCIPFSDPQNVPELLRGEIAARGWRPDWKNQLAIERDDSEYHHIDMPFRSRWYHLRVRNRSIRKMALNCTAYLESFRNLQTGEVNRPQTIELKWAGYILPQAPILPNSHRDLDAGFILYDNPSTFHGRPFTDSTYYMIQIEGPGSFELEYVVVSENFSPIRKTVGLTLGTFIDEVTLA